MERIDIFDPIDVPLIPESGLNLIEASAGTGKTYIISSLFIRLLLECNLTINDILVVTFTNAATNELKERIRAKIKEAIMAFTEGDAEDEFLKRLVKRTKEREKSKEILEDALNSFDMASIFTIHGFCLKILKQYAFECSSLFDTELAVEKDDLMEEIVRDYFRKHLFNESKSFLNYALETLKVNDLKDVVKKILTNPSVIILKDAANTDAPVSEARLIDTEKECLKLFEKTSEMWKAHREYILDYLKNDRSLNKQKYSGKRIQEINEAVTDYFELGYPLPIPEEFHYLCFDPPIPKALNKNGKPPEHPFFAQCDLLRKRLEILSTLYENKILFFKKTLVDYAKNELNIRKQVRNTRSFEDLLFDVYKVISKPEGKNLVKEISKRYRAILIDEFQDTDPLQYEIIKQIYRSGEVLAFIIGDPKQSIYGFRGADIFSYIKAANDSRTRWTLEFNYRSSESLIRAVNTLFEHIKNPFLLDDLEFKPIKPARTDKQGDILVNGEPDKKPLKIWFLENKKDEEAIKVGVATDIISKAVSDEVAKLLNMGDRGEILIDDRPLSARDIAIIVRKNKEAVEIQKALKNAGISSVIYTTDSVFSTDEAKEMLYVLSAIGEPNNESKLKSALITDIMGINANELEEITEDERIWNAYIEKFENYRNLWHHRGFIVAARTLISSENVKKRLISMEKGERKLTNILHIIELVHKACISNKLNIEGAIKWLTKKIKEEGDSTSEEYQMRLESDEEAIKILTVHRSKGLEFPVVFIPFEWSTFRSHDKKPILFHDKEKNYALTIDIRQSDNESSKKSMEFEELAENIRLLYVALTRAKKRCYLVWGKINNAEYSGLAYVLSSHFNNWEDFSTDRLRNFIKGLTNREIKSMLEKLSEKSGGTIEIISLLEYEGKRYESPPIDDKLLIPNIFSGTIDRTWSVMSFSSLLLNRPQFSELPDRDENIHRDSTIVLNKTQKKDIFTFPQGTKAGLFIHDVLEHLDFTSVDSDKVKMLVEEKLFQYGFERDWLEVIYKNIKDIVNTPLKSLYENFKLSSIEPTRRLHELEFYVPLNTIDAHGLGSIFDKHKDRSVDINLYELIKRLGFSPACGMLKGFIDMVFEFNGRFYIVDWKSNYLGENIEEYGYERIKKVMLDEYYFLQYHLYTVALHNFLCFRKKDYAYERHFGGVFYIFIRGVASDKIGSGVFYDLPRKEFIDELNTYIKAQH